MRITASNNNYNKPSFQSWRREVYKTSKNYGDIVKILQHRNDTWFCRDNFCNGKIYEYIMKKFKDIPKINTYFWGCSNGSEVYTFLNEFFSKYGSKTADKFGKITALDYDPVAIINAKLGCYPVEKQEIIDLELYHGQKISENFHVIYNRLYPDEISHIIPKQKLKDCVKFKLGDITKDYHIMKSKNNLVFAQNMWPYLDENKMHQYTKNLYKHIGKNSSLIIGDYDLVGLRWKGIQADELFKSAGFKSTACPIIYEK